MGAINLNPSTLSFLTGKEPCQVFAFSVSSSTSLPQVNIALTEVPCAADSHSAYVGKRLFAHLQYAKASSYAI